VNVHIIVPSCAAYSDAWIPFFTFLYRFWPGCPYPVTLVTDTVPPELRDYEPAKPTGLHVVGADKGWCKNFLYAIQAIKQQPEFVLMLQEDFWLSAPPDTTYIERALMIMRGDPTVACFRIYPCPGADKYIGWADHGEISLDAAYRVSCQAGIWRTSELVKILERLDTPADFEIKGTEFFRTERPAARFLSVNRTEDPNAWPFQYICTAIVRGQWLPGALEFAHSQGVPVDMSRRSVMRGPSV